MFLSGKNIEMVNGSGNPVVLPGDHDVVVDDDDSFDVYSFKGDLSEQSHERKVSWLSNIQLKLLQGKSLTSADWSFMQNMMLSSNADDYGLYIKSLMGHLEKEIHDHHDEMDAETWIGLKQRNAMINVNMFKAEKSGKRDDAVSRKMDVDVINKYMRLARERGHVFNPNDDPIDVENGVVDGDNVEVSDGDKSSKDT